MQEIIFATKNEGKLQEIRKILTGCRVISLNDACFTADITEDGDTFEANAIIKAETLCRLLGAPALADDSGLEIDYLNGAPGVLSARYLGENTPYEIKNNHILNLMKNAPKGARGARFICVIAYARPGHKTITARGALNGVIADKPAGTSGFGYDPIFYIPHLNKTAAELTLDEKNAISHRGQALTLMHNIIKGLV